MHIPSPITLLTILSATLSVASAHGFHHRRHHSSIHHIGTGTGSGYAHHTGTGGPHHRNQTSLAIKKPQQTTASCTSIAEAVTVTEAAIETHAGGCTVTATVTEDVVTEYVTVYPVGPSGVKPPISEDAAKPTDTNPFPPDFTSTTIAVAPVAAITSTSDSEPLISEAAISFTQNKNPIRSATTTTTAAAASPSSGGTAGTGKRGLAFNDASLTTGFGGSGSQVSWAYNWGSSFSGTLNPGIEFVPLLWGLKAEKTNNWNTAAQGAKHLLAFNEPDLPAQANLDPQTAATGYKTYMNPFAGKARLGSPAVTNGGSPMGLSWLKKFIDACTGCTIDFVAIHWYDSATNVAYFKNHVQDAHTQTGKPVWITEFAGSGTADQQVAFLKAVLPWLDAQPYVERYAYFGVFEGKLVTGGKPNALGNTFNTYTGS